MEEEMMYFQELIEYFKVKEAYKVDGMIEFGMEDFKKLENLLQAYKQLENENEELKATLKCTQDSWFEDTKKIEELEKENDYIRHENAIYRNETISKSEIRDKIEKLETNLSSVIQMNESMARFTTIQKLDYQIKILKEILGGNNG